MASPVRNIEVMIEPRAGIADPEVIVVGAHYDSVRWTHRAPTTTAAASPP